MFDTDYQKACLDTDNSDDDYCPNCINPVEDCECEEVSVIKINCRKCGREITTIDEGERTLKLCYLCAVKEENK